MSVIKILLVDDSKAVHALTGEILGSNNIDVAHAYNGQEALKIYKDMKDSFSLTLLDWEMPIMDGISALPLLKKSRPDTSIIMMTSKGDLSCIKEALEKGASDYIIKPYTIDILLEKVKSFAR